MRDSDQHTLSFDAMKIMNPGFPDPIKILSRRETWGPT